MAGAASLSDINQSQAGKQNVAPQKAEPNYSLGVAGVNPEEKPFVIFRLVKKKKGRIHIDGCCDNVLNPNTKRRERIWLIQGATSIWQSDLLELLKDKDYMKTNRRSIIFEDGIARIKSDDELAIEFLRQNTKNVGNLRGGNGKFDYYEYDAAQEQKARYEKQMLKINMVVKAKEMPIEKAKKLALFLGITMHDELGQLKSDDGLRTELMVRADNDPVGFQKYIDSKEVEVAYAVRRAILDAKIDLTAQQGNAIWANGKGLICKIPMSRQPYEYLTEFAMSNTPEGKEFLEQLSTFA